MAIRFTSEFRSETGIDYKIEIDDSLFVGSPSTFKVAAEGFVLEYAGETDDIVSPIMSSNVSIPFMVETVLQETFFEQLVSVQESRFRLKISRFDSGSYKTYWTGYIMQDIAQIEDVSFPYIYDLRAVDGLGRLANIDYNINNDIFQNSLALTRLNKILYNCLSSIGTTDLFGSGEAFLETCVNWWENNMVYSTTKDAANEIAVDRRIFTTIDDEGVEIYTKMIDVLRQLCVTFGSRVYQSNGRFIFEQYSERAAATRIVSTYNRSGNYIATTSKSDDVVINKTPGAARMAGNQFDFLPAIKRCEIEFQQKFMGSRVGQILFSHNRTAAQVFGFISADANASLQINCPSIRYYVTNAAPPPPSVPFNSIVPIFGLMIRIEDVNNPGVYWYYSRAFNGYNTPTPYGPASWTTTASDYMFDPGNSKFNQNGDVAILSTINIQTDQLPVSGELVFQLKQPVLRRVFNNSLLSAPPLYNGLPINSVITYNYFANVDYVSDGKLNPQSVIYRASNNNTQIESNLVLSLGFTSVADGPLQTGNLAVYTGSAWVGSDQWRKGNSGSYKKILQLVVTEALGLHAKPIRRYNGSFFFSQDISRRFTFNLYDWLFIGGRFTANIENVDGEFFAIARDVSDVVDLNNDFIDGELQPTSANKYNGPNSFGGVFTDGSIGGMLVDTDTTSVGPFSEPSAGTARITGTTTIDGDANFTQDVEVTGDLIVDGTIVIDGLGDVATEQWVIDQGYLTAESDTLDSVTDRGNVTTNAINVGGVTTDYVLLDTAATPTLQTGMFAWNDTDGTSDLRLKGNNVTLQIGQEEVIRIVNKTGSNLLESQYKVVRTRTAAEGGAQGQRLAVLLAQANTKANHTGILGLVTENINNNQEGFVTSFGFVRNINTTGSLQGQTWNDGDTLWLSDSVAGGLTNFEPTTHAVQIGYVTYSHSNNGKIFVKIDEGVDELSELHDVNTSSISADQLLKRNSSNTFWENWTPNFLTPSNVSGTTNYVSKFTGTNTVGNSQIFDNGTNVGIGTATPAQKLDVNGYITSERFYPYNSGSTYIYGDTAGLVIGGSGYFYAQQSGGSYFQNIARFRGGISNDTATYLDIQGGTSNITYFNGSIGIGTTSPTNPLHILRSANSILLDGVKVSRDPSTTSSAIFNAFDGTTNIISNSGSTSSFPSILFRTSDNTTTNELMRITGSGNVGIGTTSPAHKLSVVGQGTGIAHIGDAGFGSGNYVGASFNGTLSTTNYNFLSSPTDSHLYINRPAGNAIKFREDNTEQMTILAGGNVGIGTTSPSQKLEIQNGTVGAAVKVSNSGGGYAQLEISSNATSVAQLSFTNSLSLIGGNVGIGTTSPFSTAKLQVKTATDINVAIQTGTTNTSGIKINAFNDAGNANIPLELNGSILSLKTGEAERMHIASSGNVGINTTSPSYKLDVNGAIRSYAGLHSTGYHDSTFIENLLPAANNGGGTGDVQLRMWCSEPGVTWDWAGFGYNVRNDNGAPGGFGRVNTAFGQAYMRFATTGDWYFYNTNTSSIRTTTMTLSSGGNVGIGTTSPGTRLQIDDTSAPTIRFNASSASGGAGSIQFYNQLTQKWNLTTLATTNDFALYNNGGTNTFNLFVSHSTGNVGIGTTSPGYKLTVSGDIYSSNVVRIAGTNPFYFEDYGGGWFMQDTSYLRTYNQKSIWTGDGFLASQGGLSVGYGGATPPFQGAIINANVGIGTTSPGQKLSVEGGSIQLNANNAAANYYLILNKKSGQDGGILFNRDNASDWQLTNGAGNGDLIFYSYGTASEAITFKKANGNVGIGTTSPATPLHVAAVAAVAPVIRLQTTNSTTNGAIQWTNSANSQLVLIGSNYNVSDGSGNLEFVTGGSSTRMLITSGGNVGIGTTSPTAKLHISGTTTSIKITDTTYNRTSSIGYLDTANLYIANDPASNTFIGAYNGVFLAYGGGNVGIGTTSPSAKLHVIGNVTVSATLSTANAKISGTLADSFNQVGTAGQVLSSTGTGVEWITGGGGGGGSTIIVKDEGTTIGSSFTTLDFYGTNIQASASGSTAVITTFNNAGTGSNFANASTSNFAPGSTWSDIEIDGSILILASAPDAATGSSKLIATVTFGVENVSSFEVFNNFEFRLYNVNSSSPITDTTHTWTGFMSKDEGATRTVFTFHIPLKDEVTPGDEIRVQVQQGVSYTPEIYFCSMTLLEGTD
jgi:hypothetical protein